MRTFLITIRDNHSVLVTGNVTAQVIHTILVIYNAKKEIVASYTEWLSIEQRDNRDVSFSHVVT